MTIHKNGGGIVGLFDMLGGRLGRVEKVHALKIRAVNISGVIKFIFVAGLITGLASACKAAPVDLTTTTPELPATATPAPSSTPTETLVPTVTATAAATPIPAINMFKFHNFPQSYEYVLDHPGEFVRAPDPFTDRAAFDKWWNEEFLPALGPVTEREVNLVDGPAYEGRDFKVSGIDSYRTLDPTAFFYFMDGDVLRPVVVENCGDQESRFVVTVAAVLFDDGFNGFYEIQRMSEGYELMTILVFTALLDPNAPQVIVNPPGFVFVEKMLEAGFVGSYDDNRVIFGAGAIRTRDK